MTQTMRKLRVRGKTTLLPFQKGFTYYNLFKHDNKFFFLFFVGIIQTNNALVQLFDQLQQNCGTKYILTHRLNQDVLENFFSIIRSKGGLHDHPDQLEFKYRLRLHIMGHNEGAVSTATNTDVDDTPDLDPIFTGKYPNSINCSAINQLCIFYIFIGKVLHSLTQPVPINEDIQEKELSDFEYDGLENLAGFICHKMKSLHSDIGVNLDENQNLTWVDHLSEGGLTKPTDAFMNTVQKLEVIFQNFNPNHSLFISSKYIATLLDLTKDVECGINIKKLFFKSRMYFRIRSLNKNIIESKRLPYKRKLDSSQEDKKRKRKMRKIIE